MDCTVISQSMLFPWVGLLEQVRLADVFVHYNDVQFSKGSFVNRVQLKTASGIKWLTVPLDDLKLGQRIDEVRIKDPSEWRDRHIAMLQQGLKGTPFIDDAIHLAAEVYADEYTNIGDLSKASLVALATYFGLDKGTEFVDVQTLGVDGGSSQRVLDVCKVTGAKSYVTGHGAARYLDHEIFDEAGISVEYMMYQCHPYPQIHGEFTPYVTGLDLVANCGPDGADYVKSGTLTWREFLSEQAR